MARIIAITADKGGVGKTSTVFALSQAFRHAFNSRVLAVDLDPQANLTKVFTGIRGNDLENTLPSAIRSGSDIPVLQTESGVDLVPADITLTADAPFASVLKDFLAGADKEYDIVFLDCPPGASNAVAYCAMTLAGYVLIPATADDFAVDAIDTTLALADTMPHLKPLGIVLTLYRPGGGNIYKAYEATMRARYGGRMLVAPVRASAKFKEKLAFHEPLFAGPSGNFSLSERDYHSLCLMLSTNF